VLKESELGDVCPACGLPRKVFNDYKERMSPGRNKFLHLDLHPIAVHFAQSMLVASVFTALLALSSLDELRTKLLLMLAGGVALFCGMVQGHAGK
jgi:hypothetical protein